MNYELLKYSKNNHIATIEFNTPEKKNALTLPMREELSHVIREVKYDDDVCVIVVTGCGDAFCAGGDLSSMTEGINAVQGRQRLRKLHDWLIDYITIEKPVIASVNGPAVGAGFSLALAADIVIASEKAVLGAPFIRVGLVPDAGSLYLLPRLIGLQKAKEICFQGKILKAREAEALGLVNKVVPHDQLGEATTQMATKMAKGPARAIGMAKNMINMSFETSLKNMLEYEAYAQAIAFQTEDHKEGVEAFFQKREPVFKGM